MLKLVLETIFEAAFQPCSYDFRPLRRAHDAVAEPRHFTSKPLNYEWMVAGDITACFDEISHPALMDRVRLRISDKRVPALVKAFLKAGILSKSEGLRDLHVGTPHCGILSPLLSNVALSVLGGGLRKTDRSKDRHRAAVRHHVVKIRDGQVANRAVCVVVGIGLEGHRDALGMWSATMDRHQR